MTHTTKHTPGPWKAVPDKSRNMYTWYVEGAKGVVPTIARLSLIDACEEIESNARLIAAAPAMYEALREAQELIRSLVAEEMIHSSELQRVGNCQANMWEALAQAEARS